MQQEQIKTSLPENAYRELRSGEEYEPVTIIYIIIIVFHLI